VGVVPVLGGTVTIGDTDITNFAPERVATMGVGYVPQIDDVFPPLTVKENLEIGDTYSLVARSVRASRRSSSSSRA